MARHFCLAVHQTCQLWRRKEEASKLNTAHRPPPATGNRYGAFRSAPTPEFGSGLPRLQKPAYTNGQPTVTSPFERVPMTSPAAAGLIAARRQPPPDR